MSICDRLEGQLAKAQEGRRTLLEAVLQSALTDAAEPMTAIDEAVSPA